MCNKKKNNSNFFPNPQDTNKLCRVKYFCLVLCQLAFHLSYYLLNVFCVGSGKWFSHCSSVLQDFPHSSVGKESACNAGDLGSFPGTGRSPGEGNGNPLQYSRLENPMDGGVWQATVHGVTRVGHVLATKPPPTTAFRIPHQETWFVPNQILYSLWSEENNHTSFFALISGK